jgi:hypothetical protein
MGTAIVDLKPLDSRLAEFSKYVESIEVKNKDQYAEVSLRVKDAKTEIKKIGYVLDPGIASAKEHYDFLRNQKQGFVSKWEAQISIGDGKAKKWLEDDERQRRQEQEREQEKVRAAARQKADEERRAAEAQAKADREKREAEIEAARKAGEIGKREEARLAKQAVEDEAKQKEIAAKQAQETATNVPEVRVETSRPKIAGVPRTMHFYSEVTTKEKILNDYDAAVIAHDVQRQIFLRRFMTIDEQEVGKYAREIKDSEKVQRQLPGVRAWNNY